MVLCNILPYNFSIQIIVFHYKFQFLVTASCINKTSYVKITYRLSFNYLYNIMSHEYTLNILVTSSLIWFRIIHCNSNSNKISSELLEALKNGKTTNIFISFTNTKQIIQNASAARGYKTREDLLETIYSSLREQMEKSQQSVSATITRTKRFNQPGQNFKRFWSTNQMVVHDADLSLVNNLAMDENVEWIAEDDIAELHDGQESGDSIVIRDGEIQWNIINVGLPEAWAELGDKKGEGVILAIIDDGVKVKHEALRDNFLGDYGWFDPIRHKERPTYEGSHGTHVLYDKNIHEFNFIYLNSKPLA